MAAFRLNLTHHHHIFVYSEKAGRLTALPQNSCNNLLSSIHTTLVIILRYVRLNVSENINIIIVNDNKWAIIWFSWYFRSKCLTTHLEELLLVSLDCDNLESVSSGPLSVAPRTQLSDQTNSALNLPAVNHRRCSLNAHTGSFIDTHLQNPALQIQDSSHSKPLCMHIISQLISQHREGKITISNTAVTRGQTVRRRPPNLKYYGSNVGCKILGVTRSWNFYQMTKLTLIPILNDPHNA